MRFADTPLLWTVDEVYSAAECEAWVERIEAWQPDLATNNALYRDQDRAMRDDPELAADLFERIKAHLPERIGALTLVGLNERLRCYRYVPGQRFSPHMDHWYRPDDHVISLLSVLVYFTGEHQGGETRFMEQVESLVVPTPGRAAIFQHKLRHEGCEVLRGVKYLLRTDVLYRAPTPVTLTYAE